MIVHRKSSSPAIPVHQVELIYDDHQGQGKQWADDDSLVSADLAGCHNAGGAQFNQDKGINQAGSISIIIIIKLASIKQVVGTGGSGSVRSSIQQHDRDDDESEDHIFRKGSAEFRIVLSEIVLGVHIGSFIDQESEEMETKVKVLIPLLTANVTAW